MTSLYVLPDSVNNVPGLMPSHKNVNKKKELFGRSKITYRLEGEWGLSDALRAVKIVTKGGSKITKKALRICLTCPLL